jgi:hypothetical protein
MNDKDVTPVMYDHCKAVYDAMAEAATIVETETVRMLVWEGFLTKLVQNDLNLAVPYYSSVKMFLTRMGCIRQMRRGGGTSPSQWEVIKPPTKELFAKVDPKATARRAAQEAATQQMNDLSTRLGKLETNEATVIAIVNTLTDQLTDALDRISRLEAGVDIRRDGDANGAAA